MTDEQLEALKAAAKAATPQDIDTAELFARHENRFIECPVCGGEGNVELEADFCNYDNTAIGVQFYGIGSAHGAAEAYFRAASPAYVLSLIERLERAESALATPAPLSDEPVAWRHSKTLCLYETEEEVPLADGDEWAEPLYAAPPANPSDKQEAVADCKCRRTGDWKGFHHPLFDANWSDEQEPKLWVAFSQSGQVMAYSSVEPHQSDVMMYEPLYAARCPAPKSANDVARAIFSVLHGSTMRLPNWDSGAILGPDNVVREEFLDAAQAVLEVIYK